MPDTAGALLGTVALDDERFECPSPPPLYRSHHDPERNKASRDAAIAKAKQVVAQKTS